jgi:hypothetical protein
VHDREEQIARQMKYCTHYDGQGMVMGDLVCRAGVEYTSLGERHLDRPCYDGHSGAQKASVCPKLERISREVATAYVDTSERQFDNFLKVLPVVSAWRNRKAPYAKQGTVECPACQGKLHLAQNDRNGHVQGRCETPGCVTFIE